MTNARSFSTRWVFLASLLSAASSLAAETPEKRNTTGQGAARQFAGEVVSVEGVVFLRADGRDSSKALDPAKPGDKVFSGDIINTSSNGKIKVLMQDKSIVDLGPSALFKMDQFSKNAGADRQLDVSMIYGTMRASVSQKIEGKGRFRVRTPTATMGVRGTEFVVKSEVRNLDDMKQILRHPDRPLLSNSKNSESGAPRDDNARTEITVIQGKVEVAKQEFKLDRKPGSVSPPTQFIALTAGNQLSTQQGETALAKPITLDTKQLASIASVAKVVDNTFSRAVVIDTSPTANGGGGNGPVSGNGAANNGAAAAAAAAAGGEATRAAISNTIVSSAPPPVSLGDIGFAGTFGNNHAVSSPNQNQLNGNKHLRVVIVSK